MKQNNRASLTDRNLDQLTEFLIQEMERPTLTAQIPDGAHIFHGAYDDMTLTRDNLQLASEVLLGMTLGYIEDAPLVMVFEYEPGRRTVLDLSDKTWKDQARAFIEGFRKRTQREMVVRIKELVPT
jgi:hypothetical protein